MKHIISSFVPQAGKHSATCSVRQLLTHHGMMLSEEMIFGLACGFQFYYFEYKGMNYPLIGGRIKPKNFEENFARHSRIDLLVHRSQSEQKSMKQIVENIVRDEPVMVYVDMGELSYLHLPSGYHNGAHSVVVFGVDEEEGIIYLSDRDQTGYAITYSPEEQPQDFHQVPIAEFTKARASRYRPFPPENAWVELNTKTLIQPRRNQIFSAIRENMYHYLNPPLENMGLSGIRFFARTLNEWQYWGANKLHESAFYAFVNIDQIGGTGGGAFRKMYGQFLIESAIIAASPALGAIGEQFLFLAEQWDDVAKLFYTIYQGEQPGLLENIQVHLEQISSFEEGLANQLVTVIGTA